MKKKIAQHSEYGKFQTNWTLENYGNIKYAFSIQLNITKIACGRHFLRFKFIVVFTVNILPYHFRCYFIKFVSEKIKKNIIKLQFNIKPNN